MSTHHFTNIELADIHFAFGVVNGNDANKARPIYAERDPQRHLPYHTAFSILLQRIRDTGEKK